MMSRTSLCLHCKKRYVGCHGKCADYFSYDAERKAISAARQKSRIHADYEHELSRKINKKRKREETR